MEIFWPTSFPEAIVSGDFLLQPPSLVEVLNTDSNHPRVRKKASTGMKNYNVTFSPLEKNLLTSMMEFLDNHQDHAFWFPDPLDGTKLVKVMTMPTNEGPYSVKHIYGDMFTLSAKVSQFPLQVRDRS